MTPFPEPLSGKIKSGFAFKTIKDRLPVILTKIIDTTFRQRHNVLDQYGESGIEELKGVTGLLSELRYRMTTDKPFVPIKGKRKDINQWNACLGEHESNNPQENSWFKAPWLLAECYMYRKVMEAFDCSSVLSHFDPFQYQKEEAFIGCLSPMDSIGTYLNDWEKSNTTEPNGNDSTDEQTFVVFLQISLWGNKFDLSISSGNVINHASPLDHAQELHPFILHDDTSRLYQYVRKREHFPNRRLDIILDNAGLELFGDLCLAEYFLQKGLVDSVTFHVKSMPWFVSDVTHRDFTWTLEMLRCSDRNILKSYGHLWQDRRDKGQFKVVENDFWTLAYPYYEMKRIAPNLYEELTKSDLLIFKGDLNYRKLVGDLNWTCSTPFNVALRGFEPAPLVALRTLKADVVVGVSDEKAKAASEAHADWMISGDYAVIQYHSSKILTSLNV